MFLYLFRILAFFPRIGPKFVSKKIFFFSIQQVPFLSDNFLKAKKHLNFFNQLLKSKQIFFRSIQFDWGLKWDLGAKTFSRMSNCRSALISKQFKIFAMNHSTQILQANDELERNQINLPGYWCFKILTDGIRTLHRCEELQIAASQLVSFQSSYRLNQLPPVITFRVTAMVVVFMVSAILHEYCVSVPLRIFKAYAFFGMLLQVLSCWIVSF